MKGYIYKHTSPSGKSYIGQTYQKTAIRWRTEGKGYIVCSLFYKAIRKYGWENFTHDILEEIEFEDIKILNQLEEDYIIKFNTLAPNGYNLKTFGGNALVSEETREKLREKQLVALATKGHPWQGRNHSQESIKKMSEASKGQLAWNKGKEMWSDEDRRRISETTRKQFVEKGHPWDSKKQSDEARQKMKDAWVSRRKKLLDRFPTSNNKSGHRGVYWCKQKNKWVATIEINRKTKHLGTFKDLNEAIDVRIKAEQETWI